MNVEDSLRFLEPSLDVLYEGIKLRHLVCVDEAPLTLLNHAPGLPDVLSLQVGVALPCLLLAQHEALHD